MTALSTTVRQMSKAAGLTVTIVTLAATVPGILPLATRLGQLRKASPTRMGEPLSGPIRCLQEQETP